MSAEGHGGGRSAESDSEPGRRFSSANRNRVELPETGPPNSYRGENLDVCQKNKMRNLANSNQSEQKSVQFFGIMRCLCVKKQRM